MICRISVCENAIFKPKYKYKYITVYFLANENQLYLGFIFFSKHKLIWIPCFRPIQTPIYLGVPKPGQFEYKYDYSDWYLKIKIRIWIHSTLNKWYAYAYKC